MMKMSAAQNVGGNTNMKLYKSKDGIPGYKTCPTFLRDAYLRAIKECQHCKRKEPLEIHRDTRGIAGGLYTVCPINKKGSNVKLLCNDCHKLMHSNENPHVSQLY